jgi:DNA-binding transcriptional MerR regulator
VAGEQGLLSIGQFARACGLTAKALRHYDAVGLLAPTAVLAGTGYRRYHVDQVRAARLIRQLRELELPVAEVKRLLALSTVDSAAMTAELLAHRRRLESRVTRLQRQLHSLDHLVADKGWQDMGEEKKEPVLDAEQERKVAKALFNRTWDLLEMEERTEAEDAEMIHSAHASVCHWMVAGTPSNRTIGEWQCSRVYAVLGRAEPSLYHARKALEICQREGIGDFQLAGAYEALARATAVAGDLEEAHRWAELGRAATAEIANDGDREIAQGDLDTLPAGV